MVKLLRGRRSDLADNSYVNMTKILLQLGNKANIAIFKVLIHSIL